MDAKKKRPKTENVQIVNNAENVDKLLFKTKESKSGEIRNVYSTNDTTTLLEPIPAPVVEDNYVEVLKAVVEVDNMCDYSKCKTKVKLVGQTCDFCKKRFCFKHNLPEVHGCGEAIKTEERHKFMHPSVEKVLRKGQDHNKAQTRLAEKLNQMELARKPKAKASTKKKK